MTERLHDYVTPQLFVRMIVRDVAKDEGVDVEEEGGFWGMDNCYRMMQKLPFSAAIICCAMVVSWHKIGISDRKYDISTSTGLNLF